MKKLAFLMATGWALALSYPCLAAPLEQTLTQYPQVLDTLVGYPPEVRQAVLTASLYPNTLWEMERKQIQTRDQFQKLISSTPRKTQEEIYNLVRYPELMDGLVDGGKKSKSQINQLTRNYPKKIRDAALDLGRKDYPLLQAVHSLYLASDREFAGWIGTLPASSQEAFRTLLRYPEVLQTLSDNREFILALGEAYRKNPKKTEDQLTATLETAEKRNQEALEDYRTTLQQDPQAQRDLKNSAQEFARQYGYEDYDDDYPPPSQYSGSTYFSININPYPYWFGYPYWYSAPFWRPYPLWYMTGFWPLWGNGFYSWGWPSYYYTNWFYSYPRHFYRYPYLASCYGNYYYRWRNYPPYNNFYRVVNDYHYYNRRYIPQDSWSNDRNRVDQWRDYGRREQLQRRPYTGAYPSYQPKSYPTRGETGYRPPERTGADSGAPPGMKSGPSRRSYPSQGTRPNIDRGERRRQAPTEVAPRDTPRGPDDRSVGYERSKERRPDPSTTSGGPPPRSVQPERDRPSSSGPPAFSSSPSRRPSFPDSSSYSSPRRPSFNPSTSSGSRHSWGSSPSSSGRGGYSGGGHSRGRR